VFHAVVEKNGETNIIYPSSIDTMIVGNLKEQLKNTYNQNKNPYFDAFIQILKYLYIGCARFYPGSTEKIILAKEPYRQKRIHAYNT